MTSDDRPVPPTLPVERSSGSWRVIRVLILGAAQAAMLLLLGWALSGMSVSGVGAAVLGVVVLAVLNAVAWPLVVRVALPVVLITLGLFTFVLNALFIWVAAEFVDGIEVRSFWTALGVAFWLTVVNLFVGGLLNINDDHVWRQQVVQRMVRRTGDVTRTDVPNGMR